MVAWCRNNPSLVIQSGAKRVVGEGGWKLLEAEAAVSAVLLFVKEVIVMYCAVMCYLASTVAASGCHCRHCHCHWFFLAGKTIDEEFSHFVHMHWLTVRFNLINSLSHSYNRSSCSELE